MVQHVPKIAKTKEDLSNLFELVTIRSNEQDVILKGTFFAESTDVFVTIPNRRTFFFPETENLNFGV